MHDNPSTELAKPSLPAAEARHLITHAGINAARSAPAKTEREELAALFARPYQGSVTISVPSIGAMEAQRRCAELLELKAINFPIGFVPWVYAYPEEAFDAATAGDAAKIQAAVFAWSRQIPAHELRAITRWLDAQFASHEVTDAEGNA